MKKNKISINIISSFNCKNFSGLLKRNAFLSFSFAILLFSLAGLPPLSGFFGKLYILISAVDKKLYFLAVIAVITSIISAYYYLKIIKVMFFDNIKINIHTKISFTSKLIILTSIVVSISIIVIVSELLEIISSTSIIN